MADLDTLAGRVQVPIAQRIPDIADRQALRYPVAFKKGFYDESCAVSLDGFPDAPDSRFKDVTTPEAGVKVYFYVGSPSDRIGKNGDFYLEEETNVLYGPKSGGVWPEEGVKVTGTTMRKTKREAQEAWSVDLAEVRRASTARSEFLLSFSRALELCLGIHALKAKLTGHLTTLVSHTKQLFGRQESQPIVLALAATCDGSSRDAGIGKGGS